MLEKYEAALAARDRARARAAERGETP